MKNNNILKIIIIIIFVALLFLVIFQSTEKVTEAKKKEATIEELQEFTSIDEKNEINTYELKDISEKQMSTIYYNDLKNLIINYPEDAYDMLINKNEINKTAYDNFRINLINNYYNNKIINYKEYTKDGKKVYEIENNYNQKIYFYIDSVMNYRYILKI